MTKIYDLSLDNRSRYVDNLFSYKTEQTYNIGDVVLVPFGMANKTVAGVIIRQNTSLQPSNKIKSIISKLDDAQDLTAADVDIAQYIKDEYMCSYYDAIKLFMPPSGYSKKSENFVTIVELKDAIALKQQIAETRKNAKNKLIFFEKLLASGEINKEDFELEQGFKIKAYIDELVKLGIVELKKLEVFETSSWETKPHKKIILNQEQENAFDTIIDAYNNHDLTPVMLHGVTGSGKTAVYIEVVKYILSKGKTALILVPEISLTMQTIDRFTSSFEEDIAVIHSGLTKRQRFDQWIKIKKGVSKIIIGARSALFAPIDNLGVIIIDEFHDGSYKSEQSPKYDAIELAEYIAKVKNSMLILSSATPSIASYYKAKQGIYKLATIKNRANNLPMPDVEIVDMLKEIKTGNSSDISRSLKEQMQIELAKGNQVLLFINKRGYSNNLTCDNCGDVIKCPNCDITLTYHKYDETLKCHYCGHTQRVAHTCESCHEGNYIMMNTGTQKIEIEVRSLFPKSKVFRLDKDTATNKESLYEILESFKNEPSSILIGTQMIGKGHDFPSVTLVGVIDADKGMNSPSYNALEKSFNIIEQVAGRSGRGEERGKVIIQTYAKNNPIFAYLSLHDYIAFYNDEIQKRQIYSYEPFGNIISVTVISENEDEARKSASMIKDALIFYNTNNLDGKLKVYNAEPALITKIDNKYRYKIIIRAENEILKKAKKMIDYTVSAKRKVVLTSDNVSVSIDVNPENMV
ncbi:primosomal protein N' [Criibacterium bergeronii]|uniref:Replication restart protein PriA n=1 Tax=Criibacterium bergeronii TaxID=1871336 RepID=A0A552V505_9FIRM|nr:primosomal protein N' [Criibacterium bergeronii]TRW25554.1 primosomal protein N' [Criibacterium bergeronii]